MARRIRAVVAYDGTDFHGWQSQPSLPTIQGVIEGVLEQIDKQPVAVAGSGRTDAGVHALAQVAAFWLDNPIPAANLKKAMNRLLPASVRILSMDEAQPDFHPRFDAVAKTYEYRIWRAEVCPPFEYRYVHHHPYPLALTKMQEIACLLTGEHDFSAFAAADESDSEERTKVRTIFSSSIESVGDALIYRVRGSGFLKHMVRNLVGVLLEAGKGNFQPNDLTRTLVPGVTTKAGANTAPAKGLTLISVEYTPDKTGIENPSI